MWEGQIGTISALAPPTPKNTETLVNLACPSSKTQIHSSIWHVQLHTRRNISRFGMPKSIHAEVFLNLACPNTRTQKHSSILHVQTHKHRAQTQEHPSFWHLGVTVINY